VDSVRVLSILEMGAEVDTTDPDAERSPSLAFISRDHVIIGVIVASKLKHQSEL
jgi:hypothetical protein